MKTMITLTMAALVALAARAEVITKGGAGALMKQPAVRSEKPVRPEMTCPLCKSEFAKVTSPASKGSAPVTVTVERHACVSCGNKWVTTGHGKAKVEKAVHACSGCKS